VWDLLSDEQHPWTWSSADAAGLPIFPGLVRYDEVASGEIKHALRFTLTEQQGRDDSSGITLGRAPATLLAVPMGMRLRLKSSFDISPFPASVQVMLTPLKKYGMIMADNGSSMYLSGAPNNNWN